MERLTGLEVLVAIIDHGGFSRAAARLGMSPAMVSKHVARLEDRLGARLIDRSTRRFALTRRDPATWEVLLPVDMIYVPREAAVRLFAHQLASMTDHRDADAGEGEKVQLARLLNALLQPPAR